jgi:hypothetical protein
LRSLSDGSSPPLANGGVNPLKHERVVDAESCHCTLAVVATAGLYETSGDWLYDIGLPGKSGIGGGIVTVAPGKGGLGTSAPLLGPPGTAPKDNSPPRSCRGGSDWTCSRRKEKREPCLHPHASGEVTDRRFAESRPPHTRCASCAHRRGGVHGTVRRAR